MNGTAVGDRLNYTIGAYYFKEAGHLHDYVIFPGGLLMIDGPNDLDDEGEGAVRAPELQADRPVRPHARRALHGRDEALRRPPERRQRPHVQDHRPPSSSPDPAALASSFGIRGGRCHATARQLPAATWASRATPSRSASIRPACRHAGLHEHLADRRCASSTLNDDIDALRLVSKGYKTGSWTTRLSAPHPVYDALARFRSGVREGVRSGHEVGAAQPPAAPESRGVPHRLRAASS